uniref:Uncharacterized protein n=1 Tax=Rhizophagus irregularis (strain DAOM 181602 / DAOM 197198 / MUCL 43194) TaxID=747089 RepID=U9TY61_RHIID
MATNKKLINKITVLNQSKKSSDLPVQSQDPRKFPPRSKIITKEISSKSIVPKITTIQHAELRNY